ncbi:marginal zone B and B1 cell-specific protein [Perkinsus olseni]|uniref:Marginal zone B and B1 cell-specific protein n=1 Tax=Perkinsus olseni TaxID=32597 RepID=A0A7J6RFE6_PEROL|nr:marginal zone B and B1 cell-specific protein [Perkinsus olseni]
MVSSTRLSYCTAALIFLVVSAASKEDGRRVMQQIKLEAPNLSQEDMYSPTLPQQYRCDACRAISHHIDKSLRKDAKKIRARQLPEYEIIDKFDAVCEEKSFDGYGIRRGVNGENVLSGVGVNPPETLTLDSRAGGGGSIQMGGQQWSRRLSAMCRQLVEEVGEYELVQKWAEKGEDTPAVWLCNSYCAATDNSTRPGEAVVPSRHEDDEMTLKEFMRRTGFKDDTFTGKRTRLDWVRVIADFARALNSDQSKASSRHADEL